MSDKTKDTTILVAYDDSTPLDESAPEKGLLLAILMNAMNDAKRPGSDRERAVEYLLSPEEDYIFSFRSICSYLNVDPSVVLQVVGLDTVFEHSIRNYKNIHEAQSKGI
jgi:hypothetical protein